MRASLLSMSNSGTEHPKKSASEFKPILTKGERAVLTAVQGVALTTGAEVFPKIRVADIIKIDNSGISGDLYSYALKAHFDVLLVRDNYPVMAIEFDGSGHDSRNDPKKAAICDRFKLPLVRVTMRHVSAINFEDDAISFLIHQLDCVDAFMESYGSDPYEPYDPAWFVTIPGKDRHFPFDYANRWRGRLVKRLKENALRFEGELREIYANGLVNLGCFEASFLMNEDRFRSVSGLNVSSDRAVWGLAELDFEVHGLSARRRELFMELMSFVDGLAASEMFDKAVAFLSGSDTVARPVADLDALLRGWSKEGFLRRRAWNLNIRF
jgi:hypothetical protein